jgi:hypothetical protein
VELVIFYKTLGDFKGQKPHQAEILRDMQAQLRHWCQNPVPGLSLQFIEQKPNALQLQLASTDLSNRVDLSVLPAFDAVGKTVVGPPRELGTIEQGAPVIFLGIHEALKIAPGRS